MEGLLGTPEPTDSSFLQDWQLAAFASIRNWNINPFPESPPLTSLCWFMTNHFLRVKGLLSKAVPPKDVSFQGRGEALVSCLGQLASWSYFGGSQPSGSPAFWFFGVEWFGVHVTHLKLITFSRRSENGQPCGTGCQQLSDLLGETP